MKEAQKRREDAEMDISLDSRRGLNPYLVAESFLCFPFVFFLFFEKLSLLHELIFWGFAGLETI